MATLKTNKPKKQARIVFCQNAESNAFPVSGETSLGNAPSTAGLTAFQQPARWVVGRQVGRQAGCTPAPASTRLRPYHLFPQQRQRRVEVGRLVGEQAVGVVPAAAQVVLDHGLLHVHPLHFSPGAAARVEQAAEALGQRGQTLDTGHSTQRAVSRFTIHGFESGSRKLNNGEKSTPQNRNRALQTKPHCTQRIPHTKQSK